MITEDDPETVIKAGIAFSIILFEKLLEEEYAKLQKAGSKDVFDESKKTTLPISKEIAEVYIYSKTKFPWFIDLLNINLNNTNLEEAKRRINLYMETFLKEGKRITENLDFFVRTIDDKR